MEEGKKTHHIIQPVVVICKTESPALQLECKRPECLADNTIPPWL
jgi:hypothetical protein